MSSACAWPAACPDPSSSVTGARCIVARSRLTSSTMYLRASATERRSPDGGDATAGEGSATVGVGLVASGAAVDVDAAVEVEVVVAAGFGADPHANERSAIPL